MAQRRIWRQLRSMPTVPLQPLRKEFQPSTVAHLSARSNRKVVRFCTSTLHTTRNSDRTAIGEWNSCSSTTAIDGFVLMEHKGHVGLLAWSGMLNGFFGRRDERHIAHWRAVKHVDEFNEEGEEAGVTIIRRRERFSHERTLAFGAGRILDVKG